MRLAKDSFSEPIVERLALEWISREITARLLIDGALKLLWANAGAQSLLTEGHELSLHNGVLAANAADNQSLLLEFIRNCGSRATTLLLPSGNVGHIIFRAQLIGRDSDRHFIGVQLARTEQFEPQYLNLAVAFGLTRSEHRVLQELLAGQTADEIAEREGTAIGTIRTHIRHIYDKLHVTSREALFRVVAPYQLCT